MKFHPSCANVALFIALLLSLAVLAGCHGGGGGGGGVVENGSTSKAWGTAVLIETDNTGDASRPRIAMDAYGNALATWCQLDGTRYNIWANRYTAGSGWGTAELIETDNAGGAYDPVIAMDANGNALAVWQQSDGARNNIWANRYTAGSGWGTAELIETDNAGGAYDPRVAMNANGDAMAVWFQSDGIRQNIVANHYTAGIGWGTAVIIETDNAGDAWWPNIAIDTSGNALAVWYQRDGMLRDNIWANRYTAGVGWGTAELIETDDAGNAYSPQVAFDANGNALAVWGQWDGTRSNIVANRYTAGVGWGTAELIEAYDVSNVGSAQVAFDANGNALAVWGQGDITRGDIAANRYTAGVGWGTAELIETDKADIYVHQFAMNTNGNALVVWGQGDGTRANIVANHYTPGVGWGTAELIETDNAGDAWYPEIAIDTNGNALAVWFQSDGTRFNIWANRFD